MVQHNKRIRVVIAKLGCDIHERGALTLMMTFRNAGMEVIYTGRYQSPEAVVRIAVEEDIDVLALTDHTGGMKYIAESVIKELKKLKANDIPIIAGGLIPPRDVPALEKMGVTGNFGPGTPLDTILNHVLTVAGRAKDDISLTNKR
jgi:methylmalonyl-CoA mutase C-terminal domain/subunit